MDKSGLKNDLVTDNTPQPKLIRPKNIGRLAFLLSILCLTTFYCGYCMAYIAALGANNVAIVYGEVTKQPVVKAFLLACLPYGITFGTFLSPWIIPLTTRSLIAEVLQLIIQAPNLYVFYIVRTFQGVVTGLFLALIPIYVREISPKDINKKGIYGVFGQIFVMLGFMVSFGLNTIMLKTHLEEVIRWHFVVSVNFFAILIIIISILTKIMPESPNSLIMRGQEEQAKKVIGLFHRQNFIDQIYVEKVKQVEDMKKPPEPPKKDRPKVRTILTFEIPIMHQFTGVFAYIAQMGFVTSNFDNSFGDYVPFMMGTTQVLTGLYSVTYLYRIHRRTMVLSGNLGMSICCFGMGMGYLLIPHSPHAFWIVVAFLVIFFGFHGATLIPAVWLYIPEIATKPQLRWSQVVNWFCCGTSIVVFVIIGQTFGFHYIFLTFGTFTMICFIFNSIFLIETKPKLKEQVNIELAKIQINQTFSDDKEEESHSS